MDKRPGGPQFKVGQVVVIKRSKKQQLLRIVDMCLESGEYFYAWNSRNMAAEHMLRPLTDEEKG